MKDNKAYYLLSIGVFLLAVFLRLELSLLNREANDPHIKVIRLILQTGQLPTQEQCPECFQPKLFHYSIAVLIQRLQNLGFETERDSQIVIGQLVNFLAGLGILGIVWVFISDLPVRNWKWKFFAFALAALNPKMIGINSQVTNDTFLILFSTAAIYCAFRFLRKPIASVFICAILFSVLAVSSKSSGWAAVLSILIAIIIKGLVKRETLRSLYIAAIYLIAVPGLTFLNPLSQYPSNLRTYGSPILASISERRPFPNLFVKTYYSDSGIISIQDGFFTFRFFELLQHPRIERGDWTDQPYRTSFWTLLYGRAHSVHFDNWPVSWSTSGDVGFLLSRVIFLLALLPTFLILFGLVLHLSRLFRSTFREDQTYWEETGFGVFLLALAGYLAFVILFALLDRGYQVIKAIFVFPAILALIFFFLHGIEQVELLLQKWNAWIVSLLYLAMGTLLVFYALDIYTLIVQLRLQSS